MDDAGNGARMIRVTGLSHSYGRDLVLNDLNFVIHPGEIFALLGPNGAGKSTLINILITMIKCNSGRVEIDGIDLDADPQAIRSRLGVVFQDSTLDERLTARENLYFHSRLYGIPRQEINGRVAEALDGVGLGERAGELVMNLSGGMKRRLEIARAYIHRPKILILDEPTTGLDPQSRKAIWERIGRMNRESGTTVVLSTQYLEEAEACSRIAIIDRGRVVAIGSPDAIRAHGGKDRVFLKASDHKTARKIAESRIGGLVAEKGENASDFAVRVANGSAFIAELHRALGDSVLVTGFKRPTLEDAFIALTGKSIGEEKPEDGNHIRNLVRERKLA